MASNSTEQAPVSRDIEMGTRNEPAGYEEPHVDAANSEQRLNEETKLLPTSFELPDKPRVWPPMLAVMAAKTFTKGTRRRHEQGYKTVDSLEQDQNQESHAQGETQESGGQAGNNHEDHSEQAQILVSGEQAEDQESPPGQAENGDTCSMRDPGHDRTSNVLVHYIQGNLYVRISDIHGLGSLITHFTPENEENTGQAEIQERPGKVESDQESPGQAELQESLDTCSTRDPGQTSNIHMQYIQGDSYVRKIDIHSQGYLMIHSTQNHGQAEIQESPGQAEPDLESPGQAENIPGSQSEVTFGAKSRSYIRMRHKALMDQLNSFAVLLVLLAGAMSVAILQPPGSFDTDGHIRKAALPYLIFASMSFLLAMLGLVSVMLGFMTLSHPVFYALPRTEDTLDGSATPVEIEIIEVTRSRLLRVGACLFLSLLFCSFAFGFGLGAVSPMEYVLGVSLVLACLFLVLDLGATMLQWKRIVRLDRDSKGLSRIECPFVSMSKMASMV